MNLFKTKQDSRTEEHIPEYHVLIDFVKDICAHVREGVKAIHKNKDFFQQVQHNQPKGEPSLLGDVVVEGILAEILREHLKSYSITNALIISEERGQWFVNPASQYNHNDIFCIIDPLDGSRNLRTHWTPKPRVAFSIACGYARDLFTVSSFEAIRVGVIEDIFYDSQYIAVQKAGSFLHDMEIHGSPHQHIEQSIVGASLDHTGVLFNKIMDHGIHALLHDAERQRRMGSTVVDLCQVATGDYDAYVSLSGGVKLHDIAAAQLILREAGCTIGMRKNFSDHWKEVGGYVDILKRYIHGGDESVKTMTFQVVAAGNRELYEKVLNYVS